MNAWLDLFERPTDALIDINKSLSGKYTTSNLTQWKKEQKGLSPRAYNYMLKYILDGYEDPGYDELKIPDPRKGK